MIGKVLNHSQPSSTAIYARLHIDPVRESMEKHSRNISQVLAKSESDKTKKPKHDIDSMSYKINGSDNDIIDLIKIAQRLTLPALSTERFFYRNYSF